jgi:hypothetical protein
MSHLGFTGLGGGNFTAFPVVRPVAMSATLRSSLVCGEILDAMPLPSVPCNDLLVKGIFETQEEAIPLVDIRTAFRDPRDRTGETAVGVIVKLGKRKLGLILDGATDD